MTKLTLGSWMSALGIGLITASMAPQVAWTYVAAAVVGACFASWKWPWL